MLPPPFHLVEEGRDPVSLLSGVELPCLLVGVVVGLGVVLLPASNINFSPCLRFRQCPFLPTLGSNSFCLYSSFPRDSRSYRWDSLCSPFLLLVGEAVVEAKGEVGVLPLALALVLDLPLTNKIFEI